MFPLRYQCFHFISSLCCLGNDVVVHFVVVRCCLCYSSCHYWLSAIAVDIVAIVVLGCHHCYNLTAVTVILHVIYVIVVIAVISNICYRFFYSCCHWWRCYNPIATFIVFVIISYCTCYRSFCFMADIRWYQCNIEAGCSSYWYSRSCRYSYEYSCVIKTHFCLICCCWCFTFDLHICFFGYWYLFIDICSLYNFSSYVYFFLFFVQFD